MPIQVNCIICNKIIQRDPCKIKRNKNFFCSRICYEKWWKEKVAIKFKGEGNVRWGGGVLKKICLNCNKEFRVQRNQHRKGKAKFCSHQCSAKYKFIGEKNPNWKGGVSKQKTILKSAECYKCWRNKVFRRDRWTCKLCGYRSKYNGQKKSDIEAHHIIPMSKNIKKCLKVGNGITLCKKCHLKTYNKEENFIMVFRKILNDFMPNIPKG